MDKRTDIFGIACVAFAWHAIGNGKQADIAAASYAAQRTATVSADDANRVRVDVFNIRRGGAGVKVQNISGERLKSVFLHCTFRNQYGERIDSVPVYLANLDAGDTANESANMANDIKASSVDCRTEHAYTG